MELDVPMMEIGHAFGAVVKFAEKTLSDDARALGARWLRGRIESSPTLRWNPVRKKALELAAGVAHHAVTHSAANEITDKELAAAIRQLGAPDGTGKIRMEECPF